MKKVRFLKYLLILIIPFLFCGCSNKNDNELVLVTEAGFSPYEYYENNEIVGVDIALAQDIANSLGKKLVVKDVAFDSLINEINSGKADFAAAGMSITPERLKSVDFTIEYATSNQVVVTRADSSMTSIDLIDKTIAVQLGTDADIYVTDNYPNNTIIRQKKYLAAAEDVKNGKADCLIMDSIPATELVKENSELKILDGVLYTASYGMAIKKGNTELLDKINEILTKEINDGKVDEYILKYSK